MQSRCKRIGRIDIIEHYPPSISQMTKMMKIVQNSLPPSFSREICAKSPTHAIACHPILMIISKDDGGDVRRCEWLLLLLLFIQRKQIYFFLLQFCDSATGQESKINRYFDSLVNWVLRLFLSLRRLCATLTAVTDFVLLLLCRLTFTIKNILLNSRHLQIRFWTAALNKNEWMIESRLSVTRKTIITRQNGRLIIKILPFAINKKQWAFLSSK